VVSSGQERNSRRLGDFLTDIVESGVADSASHADPAPRDAGLVQPGLGRALRQLRRERGLALADVAVATDLSSSFLSVVEKGRSDIAIGRLMRIMRFYGVRIADLLGEPSPRTEVVVRDGEGHHIRSESGVELYLLAPDTDREMMPVLSTFEPHARLTNLEAHDGETFIHVLAGTLLLELEGQQPLVLHEGDSAYYKPNPAPKLTNLGERPLRVLGTVTPPTL
jgi:quercetin dioxygenase-like cupin family protein